MTKKIFLSGIYHETHTFLSQATTLKDFAINIGDDIIKENTGNGSPTDGFIEFASQKISTLFIKDAQSSFLISIFFNAL